MNFMKVILGTAWILYKAVDKLVTAETVRFNIEEKSRKN